MKLTAYLSMINYDFSEDKNSLFIQKEYTINNQSFDEIILSPTLTINKGTNYFIEIKNSYPNNIVEIIKKNFFNVFTFRKIFIKEKRIDAHFPNEILIIYDFKKADISSGIAKTINLNNLYNDLEGLKIKIIYCKPKYIFYSLNSLVNEIAKIKAIQQAEMEEMKVIQKSQQATIESLQKELADIKKSMNYKSND